jgi:acyl-CoA oxidase
MTSTQLDEARDKLNEYLGRVRKNALNICDSFDIPDRVLCTVLGRRDGHVYKNLLEWAKKSEPNQTSVLPFHHRTIGKLMKDRKIHSKL